MTNKLLKNSICRTCKNLVLWDWYGCQADLNLDEKGFLKHEPLTECPQYEYDKYTNKYICNWEGYCESVVNSIKMHYDMFNEAQTWIKPWAFITGIINCILTIIQLILLFPQYIFTKDWFE